MPIFQLFKNCAYLITCLAISPYLYSEYKSSSIVSFKDSSDSSQIMTDFNLSLKRNLLPINRAVYYVSSFKNIENIFTKLREDPRITEVSLGLINPMISAE